MEDKYTNIKIESDKKVTPNTITKLIAVSEDEPTLIRNLLSTKNYTDVLIKRQNNILTVIAIGENKKPGFEFYRSKYAFLGLRCTFPFINVTHRLDNLFVKVSTDLPSHDFNSELLSYLKSNLFYKQSLKVRYTRNLWGSGPILKLDAGKTAKVDHRHIGFNISAINLLTVWGRKIDMQLKNRVSKNKLSEIDYDTLIKLRFKSSDLNYDTLPQGGKTQLKLIHSVLTTNLYKFKAEFNIKRFIYSRFLPEYSNIEVNLQGLLTNDSGQKLGNLRGFSTLDKTTLQRCRSVMYASLKYNYFNFNALMDIGINPFIHVSGKLNESVKANWDIGFGVQKMFRKVGTFEVMYNYRQQNLQLRFEPF